MWIEKSKDKYRACAYYRDPLTLTRHKVGVTISKNTAQQRNIAKQKLDRIILERSSYTPEGITLGHLISAYKEYQQKTVKESTCRRNMSVCKSFMDMLGTDADVNLLSARVVKSRLMAYTTNATTYNEYIGRFKSLMRWGFANDYVKDISWLDKLSRIKDKTPKEKVADKYLERSECELLISSIPSEEWRMLTQFLILSGLRIGEAFALNRSDISLDTREIYVTKTLDPHSRQITTPKTLSSSRTVYMQDDLHALCASLVAFAERKRISLGLHTPLLFFDLTGDYGQYDTYKKALRVASEHSLGRRITPHVLRHTHASLLAEQDLPLDLISRRLGHDNSKITRDIYIHITEQKRKKDNAMIKNISLF